MGAIFSTVEKMAPKPLKFFSFFFFCFKKKPKKGCQAEVQKLFELRLGSHPTNIFCFLFFLFFFFFFFYGTNCWRNIKKRGEANPLTIEENQRRETMGY